MSAGERRAVRRLPLTDRRVAARTFVNRKVRMEVRDALGVHVRTGRVLAVAPMPYSGQTDAVIVLNTQDGDIAVSLAQVESLVTEDGGL